MNNEIKKKLEQLQSDYTVVTGQPFRHFYCPILFRDDEKPLCKGHIINKAFKNSSRAWTIQREDVDNFYGSNFEADFETIQYAKSHSKEEIFMDKKLRKKIEPKISINDRQVDYFVTNGQIPEHFTPIEFKKGYQSIQVGLKISPGDFVSSVVGKWSIDIYKDIRIAALVSLIKAAYLTLFELLGYKYTLSAAGEYVGSQILGEFFRNNCNQKKAEVLQNAMPFFREFATMVRPALSVGIDFKGTITDRMLFVCRGSSGVPWAIIVLVKTGQLLHFIMLPTFEHHDNVPTFIDFLKNQNESISVTLCRYEQEDVSWSENKEATRLVWPKTGVLYP